MIDKKKIEEAADEYALIKSTPNGVKDYDINLRKGFVDGINWFKENLWHNATKEPKLGKMLLTERKVVDTPIYEVHTTIPNTLTWKRLKKCYSKMTRWLYIEDLMKEEK